MRIQHIVVTAVKNLTNNIWQGFRKNNVFIRYKKLNYKT